MTGDKTALPNGREVPMRVIVAGVHRTGTLSMTSSTCIYASAGILTLATMI